MFVKLTASRLGSYIPAKLKWHLEKVKKQELIGRVHPCINEASERSSAQGTSTRYVHLSLHFCIFKLGFQHLMAILFSTLQVWEDVRKPQGVHDGKLGPLGTTDR